MPIKDLVERYRFGDGLPRFAIIRKGAPKPNEKQPGADLPHFRVVMQTGFERYLSVVQQLYGAEPQSFTPVRFLGATMDDVFSFWMEEHRATKMLHQCDGEQQVQWFDKETGEYCRGAAPCLKHATPACACKPSASLNLSLPDLNREIGLPGYVTMLTTSWEDVRNLMSCFKDIERMGYFDLRRVEFTIGRAPKAVNTPVPEPKKPADIKKFRETHGGRDWKPGEKAKRVKSLIYIRVTERFSREFMLPPDLSAPQLPPGDANPAIIADKPKIESVTGRKVITDGGGSQPPRRIGAPATEFQPEPPDIEEGEFEEDEADEEQVPVEIWADDAAKWNAFLKSAKERFSMTAKTVAELLDDFAGYKLADWRQSRGWALAALVAAHCQYDAGRIDEYTSSMTGVEESAALSLCEWARQIATVVAVQKQDDPFALI